MALLTSNILNQDQPSLFSPTCLEPFLSTLPPLPQPSLPFSFEEASHIEPSDLAYRGFYREEDVESNFTECQFQPHFDVLQRLSDLHVNDYRGHSGGVIQDLSQPLLGPTLKEN